MKTGTILAIAGIGLLAVLYFAKKQDEAEGNTNNNGGATNNNGGSLSSGAGSVFSKALRYLGNQRQASPASLEGHWN